VHTGRHDIWPDEHGIPQQARTLACVAFAHLSFKATIYTPSTIIVASVQNNKAAVNKLPSAEWHETVVFGLYSLHLLYLKNFYSLLAIQSNQRELLQG